MMMGGPTLPGMQGMQQMGMSPSSLSEEQLKQLQVIMMQMQPQPQQIGSGVNVAQGMMTPEPLRAAPSSGMGLLDIPDMGAQEQPPINAEGAKNLMDMIGNKMPAGDTFQRGNYIAGIDESEFKRPMSAGYNYTFGRNNDPDKLSDLEMALKRNNLGFPAY